MAKKLYVGNLSFDSTEDNMREFFAVCATVESVTIVRDRHSGRSRGFGFVDVDDEGFQKCLEMDGKEFMDRPLKINEAREKNEGDGSQRRRKTW